MEEYIHVFVSGVFSSSGLRSITIPPTLKEIGDETFSDCRHLKTVQFSEGLQKICHSAFAFCALEKLVLPASLEEIQEAAFWGNPLREVTF